MPFKARYSTEQKQAVIDAATRYHMTGEAAHRAANEGSLPGLGQRLEPFPIALSTVRELITKERKRLRLLEEAGTDPTAVMHQEAQALAIAVKQARERVTSSKNVPTPEQITALAKAAREVHALLKALAPEPKRNRAQSTVETPQESDQEPDAEPDFIDALAANGSAKHRP
jgi:hypothetical protein